MNKAHKSRNNSEKTKQTLLTQLAQIRTEAQELGADTLVFADLDRIEGNIQSARVRRYQDFLKVEHKQLELVQTTLKTLKENMRKSFLDDMKASIVLFLVMCIPYIVISKFSYVAHVPKHIPESSVYVYLVVGDVLFDLWIAFGVLLAVVYRYLTITYVDPFLERRPSLKLPTRFASTSTLLLIYQQVLFRSADLAPVLVRPSWGPAIVSAINQIIIFLTSNSIVAVTALTTLVPLVISVLRLVGKRWPSSLRIKVLAKRRKKG